MKKLRIMQITHDLAIGGLQKVVVNICKTIDRDRFDVSVLWLRDKGPLAAEIEELNIPVYGLQQSKNTDYFLFRKIRKILTNHGIDIIHTHNTQPLIDGGIAALFSNVHTIVHTDHARDFPDKRRYMALEWLMSHFAYKIVGVSEDTTENLVKYEHIARKKVTTVPNGIDFSVFDISVNRSKKRRELGISLNGPIIGLGVRLTEQKGITYLLQAMPSVIRHFPDISLVIAGEGPLEPQLRREMNQLGLDKHVIFCGSRLDMPELLKLFDIYVLPSKWEGLPLVLIEAMAAGCPVIATAVGGNSSLIEPGTNGSLVEPCDPPSLSEEIVRLLKDRATREAYIKRARNKVYDSFSAEIMTRKYERLYLREP